ncbi:MAG: HNH endonuclease [Clostridium butyricum]|nr:HNH endonuclease [Clostridium butyricum]
MVNQEIKENKNVITKPWIWVVAVVLLIGNPILGLPIILILAGLLIYSKIYFRGKKFSQIKSSINVYIKDCNDLNAHIEDLRSSYVKSNKTDYGEAQFTNISKHNYKKKGLNAKFAPNIYDCSRQVCGNAQKQPFKYICKYFNIKANEETLSQFEEVLNNFSAAEEGKILLKNKKDDILESIKTDVPAIIRKLFAKDLEKNLGFKEIKFNELYFPQFTFRYISSGGNSGTEFTTTMDIPMLERFISYIDENVKRRKSAAGQRALMTPRLRTRIKERDNYTCRQCGNSTANEPNLLLEIDHIIPIAKGGLTEESNLQTLCWKCNRTKGSKIM